MRFIVVILITTALSYSWEYELGYSSQWATATHYQGTETFNGVRFCPADFSLPSETYISGVRTCFGLDGDPALYNLYIYSTVLIGSTYYPDSILFQADGLVSNGTADGCFYELPQSIAAPEYFWVIIGREYGGNLPTVRYGWRWSNLDPYQRSRVSEILPGGLGDWMSFGVNTDEFLINVLFTESPQAFSQSSWAGIKSSF